MSRDSAVSAIERGDFSELQHVLEESEWDIGSEPLDSKGQTGLHIACANGHLDIVQYLVSEKGCSARVENVFGITPLMLSFINKHWKMANFLLQITPNSVINDPGGILRYKSVIVMKVAKEALDISCKNGYFWLVKYLTEIGWPIVDKETTRLARCSVNLHVVKYLLTHCQCTMPDDMSEVHIACIRGDVETVKTALDSNGSSILGTADHFSTTPMHYATLEPNVLRMIVQYAKEMLLNITDSMGNTPLHHSIKYECIESVTILVKAPGCDVNLTNLKGETPLIAACKYSKSAIVQLLVASERCDINTSDSEGNAALHIVSDSIGQLENVQCLLQSDRCNPNVINKSGSTPLHIVCHRGNIPLLKVLVADKRYDLNIQDDNGDTALHIGVENIEIVKTLLESGRSRCDIYNEEGLTPFHKAIANGVMASVELMLKKGCDPNEENANGDTAIHIVSRMKQNSKTVKLLQLLLKNGADVLKSDRHGNAPIHIVCKHFRLNTLKVLLGCRRCDTNQENADGDTPIHVVSRMTDNSEQMKEKSKTVELLELLVKNGADVLKPDRHGDAPIHVACRQSRLDILKFLLGCRNCDPNQQNNSGDTALHIVCRMKIYILHQFLEVLISTQGINPKITNHLGLAPFEMVDSEGSTLLHNACFNGNFEMVLILVKNGADILKPNRQGDAPIHIACKHSRLDTLKVLLGFKSCDPNQENADRHTAIHIVLRMKHNSKTVTLLELLVKNGADVLKPDRHGDAPIHFACKHFRLNTLKVLLGFSSCDANQENADGDTPIHVVSRMRDNSEQMKEKSKTVELLELLVKNGADVLKPDRHGDAPIHVACRQSRLDILKFLLGCRNCDPNQQNNSGDTALHIVCRMKIYIHQFLKVLISTQGINPKITNHLGLAPFEIVDSEGSTLLHNACFNGNFEMVLILVKNGADILKPNRQGDAPIHIACKHSRLDTLKVILDCTNCDPNQLNFERDTALHIVCKMRTGRELQFLEVLTSTPGINPKITNHEGSTPCDVVGNDGNTLLHVACTEGNTAMVELLVRNGANILRLDRRGDAPIHIACRHFKLHILKLLLGLRSCNSNQQSLNGDTALHIVCRMTNKLNVRPREVDSALQFLQTLISTPGIDPETVNHEGLTPIEVAGTNYSAIETIKKILDHKRSSIQAYLKIFVVGNSGTGKSTLIKAVTTEASQLRKYAPIPKMRYVNTSDVPPHTAGIVPIPFRSKHFGNAVLYDFAGQHEYYSSHAAVMENLILPSPPLFLLLIDISKSKEVIREELVYWWHFINNQSQKAAAPPHVILAGSHKDMVQSREREELETMMRVCIKEIPVTFEYVGYFSLNCRKLVSQGLSALLGQLNTTCQVLRQIVDDNLHCHILNALLSTPELQGSIYCRVVDIMNRIESHDAPLPKIFSQFIPLLKSLNDQGHVLLLQNHTDERNSWVILKPDLLLTEVNGSVFAPKYFKKHSEFAMSTGVVPFSKLKEKFTEYNHEVIAAYLTHLEFCFRIKDQHTLDMITKNTVYESTTTEEYYFFPALVSVENPTDVCQSHESISYECGWLYKCNKETEQLTTRFLHVLILRLAFTCDPPDDLAETESVVLLRSCSVWKHGIAWWTNDGIEVIVEVGLQCRWVAVMLRCPDVKMVQCAELRYKVIHTVLKVKVDFCPAIAMTEYVICPSSLKYPFEGRDLTLYSMREVAKATIEGKEYAKDIRGKNLITLPQLLPFEPYENMGDLIWKFFSGDTSAAVTPKELMQLAEKCHYKLADLKTAFKPDVGSFQRECEKADCTEVERCVALFHILQRRGRFKTWRDFQQEFSRFSIFCKQSPLEHTQKDKDRTLGDDTECGTLSDGVTASDDVLPGPVPRSPIQLPSQYISHTSTDIASAEGTDKEESEKENDSHLTQVDTTHLSDNTTYQAVSEKAGLTPTMIHLENEVIPTVCPMWREVGRQLHLKTSILDEIDADCRGVRRCCTRMFEEWLKEDTEASWYAVLSACKKVKENLASGPDELYTKESIESLKQLIRTLPDFFATL